MTLQERLQHCEICANRAFNLKEGMYCSLTNEKPVFEDACPDFNEDVQAEEKRHKRRVENLAYEPTAGEKIKDASGLKTRGTLMAAGGCVGAIIAVQSGSMDLGISSVIGIGTGMYIYQNALKLERLEEDRNESKK